MRLLAVLTLVAATAASPVDRAIDAIAARPAYAHANFGVEAVDLATRRIVYSRDPDKFFVPGSTTKLVTIGAALQLLGADRRFHTRVYRTGPIAGDGTLQGDIILVATGDPNLSNRIRPDGTLAFEDEDHSYGGRDAKPVAGDPLTVIDSLAGQVAGHGIKHVAGRVRVDASLFPEGAREGGTGVVISPIVVNDNVVDLSFVGGDSEGAPTSVTTQPITSYVRFVNNVKTGAASAEPQISFADSEQSDGSHVVTASGVLPPRIAFLRSWAVPVPSRFAEVALAERLQAHGVVAAAPSKEDRFDPTTASSAYVPDRLVAEHVSLPFGEAARVVLKVSQNLHASMMPSVVGATLAPGGEGEPLQRGFNLMKQWLDKAPVDVSGASQGDGAGAEAHFSPHFMAGYLGWMAGQPSFDLFRRALPILGKDGTLAEIQKGSPAAGHVFAKTGTYGEYDRLHRALMVDGKGLAGYIDTAGGRHLAFAAYINFVRVPATAAGTQDVGEALGEIALALYKAF